MKRISLESLQNLSLKVTQGLDDFQAQQQLDKFGKNEIVERVSNPWIEILKDTFRDPMIWFLVATGSVFALLGQSSEAVTLFVAILPLTVMDAILHWRTQAATQSLKSGLQTEARVLRGGAQLTIDVRELVPGDLVFLLSGDLLPADGVIAESHELQIDESVLTGEAFPILKKAASVDLFQLVSEGEIFIPEETVASAGTRVLSGQGLLRILATGKNTAYGQIVQSISKAPHELTPLQLAIGRLVKFLIYISAGLCVLLAGVRILQGHGWLDAFLSAATLAVAAIPEEFPIVFTFFLGVGIYRLARRHALVRRAVSVENIGRVTHICTDKTGTLTVGELSLTHLDPATGRSLGELVQAALGASNPEAFDPVDVAIAQAAVKMQIPQGRLLRRFPFTEDRKREAAVIESGGSVWAFVKGAPEMIFSLCDWTESESRLWSEKTLQWAREGHKVLACARQKWAGDCVLEPEGHYEFLGLLAFEDPARPETVAAIQYARDQKIHVVMLTGDHPETARAIARDIGLGGENPKMISAEQDVAWLEESYLKSNPGFFDSVDVIARCTPLQKLKVVEAIKASGGLVAVTGDGVNDVPALKAADIGIAMGLRGTRSAREVSSMILSDDNFQTIISAIQEGRHLFANLQRAFEYLLLIHIPLVLTAALVPLLGYPLIYLPAHIVWLELIIHPTAILGFLSRAEDRGGNGSTDFFQTADVWRIAIAGAAVTLAVTAFFIHHLQNEGVEMGRAQAMALLNLWSLGLLFLFTGLRTRISQIIGLMTLILAVGFTEIPYLAKILAIQPLGFFEWLQVLAIVALISALWKGCHSLGKR